ncbi:MAG: hypothetical protein QGH60_22190 [Phycisphaerae bacterium]|jgi:hypothetical protein|nr:hypothetical protein [Phycisphaerae bacterium]
MKHVCCAVLVLCVIGLAFWCSEFGGEATPVIAGFFVMAAFGLAFWALVEQLWFSFGRPRYLSRTERKRLLHRRKKNKTGGETILGRKIPEQRDR